MTDFEVTDPTLQGTAGNPFALSAQSPTDALVPSGEHAAIAAAVSREQAEIQAACLMAHARPRDEARAFSGLMRSCDRPTFAEGACWAFPRGDQTVSGPSVRLAREAMRQWGNIRVGTRIIGTDPEKDEVHVQAFAIDLETNAYRTEEGRVRAIVFRRKSKVDGKPVHVRLLDAKQAQRELGGDVERQMQECIGRIASRLERNCILRILPADLIDDAVDRADETMRNRPDRGKVNAALKHFADKGVEVAQVLERFGRKRVDDFTNGDMAELRRIFRTVSEGGASLAEYFDGVPAEDEVEQEAPSTPAPQPETAAQASPSQRRDAAAQEAVDEAAGEPNTGAEQHREDSAAAVLEDMGAHPAILDWARENNRADGVLRITQAKRPPEKNHGPRDLWLKQRDGMVHAWFVTTKGSGWEPIGHLTDGPFVEDQEADPKPEAVQGDAPATEQDASEPVEDWRPAIPDGEYGAVHAGDEAPADDFGEVGDVFIVRRKRGLATTRLRGKSGWRISAQTATWVRSLLANEFDGSEAELTDRIGTHWKSADLAALHDAVRGEA